jgi:hypothetical protein
MKRALSCFLTITLLSGLAMAQNRTYLGWEGGAKWDFFSMDDRGYINNIKKQKTSVCFSKNRIIKSVQ